MRRPRIGPALAAGLVFLLSPGCARGPDPISLSLTVAEDRAAVLAVVGLSADQLAEIGQMAPERQAELLQVFVEGQQQALPPMLGDVSIQRERLCFTPRYPLEPGLTYRAAFHRDRLRIPRGSASGIVWGTFPIAKRRAATTAVAHIYPSADRLPENQLRFYLLFSAPMSRGEAYRHVHLLDDRGAEVEGAFLELGEELWDPAMRRFTLLLDPGRVKRGLKPREDFGPVLEEGRDYTLVVDRDWSDAAGNPLGAAARKMFCVLPPDDAPIDPTLWSISPPKAGTRDPLAVEFPKPLDHALLERLLAIAAADGQSVPGKVDVDQQETRWRFTPELPWAAATYQLQAAVTLEDPAGNSIARAFDVDLLEPIEKKITTETISIPVVIKAEE